MTGFPQGAAGGNETGSRAQIHLLLYTACFSRYTELIISVTLDSALWEAEAPPHSRNDLSGLLSGQGLIQTLYVTNRLKGKCRRKTAEMNV